MPSTATHLQLLSSPERDADAKHVKDLDERMTAFRLAALQRLPQPIRVVIDEPEMLIDVVDGLDEAVNYAPGDQIRTLRVREKLVELMNRAIHRESPLCQTAVRHGTNESF